MRQLIIARKDLQMSPGKLAAQCCHASLAFLTDPIGMGQGVEPIEKDGEVTGYRAVITLDKATYTRKTSPRFAGIFLLINFIVPSAKPCNLLK